MTTHALTRSTADRRADHFRKAELELWHSAGLDPVERFVDVDEQRLRLRILEIGTGDPVLFIHGTAGSGAWPSLVRELRDYRCLVLERPGWGLSTPLDYGSRPYGELTAAVVAGVLDALGIRRAAMVGSSIGNVWALRAAAVISSRVAGAVLMGGGPIVQDVGVPGIIRLIASPIGALLVRLPESPGRVRAILRAGGHAHAVDAGVLDGFIGWRMALGRDTRSMLTERAMVRSIVRGNAYRKGVTFDADELARIDVPTLIVFGTEDPTGSIDLWRRIGGGLGQGQVTVVDGAAHEPWIEAPGRVAGEVRRFLGGLPAPRGA